MPSITESTKGKIIPSPRRKSFVGGTPPARGPRLVGARGTNRTRGQRSRNGCGSLTLTCSRFGVVKETADPRKILLDLDGNRAPNLRPVWAVCRLIGLRPLGYRLDRTRKGWHLVIWLSFALTPAETVAVQACMGSDPRREALNAMRVIAIRRNKIRNRFWLNRWNLLYAEKL